MTIKHIFIYECQHCDATHDMDKQLLPQGWAELRVQQASNGNDNMEQRHLCSECVRRFSLKEL